MITTLNLGKSKAEILLKEVIAYYSRVAIATIMVRYGLHGKENYDKIETRLFETLSNTFDNKSRLYLLFATGEIRHIAESYFVSDHDGLGITEDQVYAFAKQFN